MKCPHFFAISCDYSKNVQRKIRTKLITFDNWVLWNEHELKKLYGSVLKLILKAIHDFKSKQIQNFSSHSVIWYGAVYIFSAVMGL